MVGTTLECTYGYGSKVNVETLKRVKMTTSIIVQCFSYFARECLSTSSGLLVEKNSATNATIVIRVPTMKISSRKPMPNPNCPGYSARNGFKLEESRQILYYKCYVDLRSKLNWSNNCSE